MAHRSRSGPFPSPPRRQARGTMLNTIMEDNRETSKPSLDGWPGSKRSFGDLYDATDNESDECPSPSSSCRGSRPSRLAPMLVRDSTGPTSRRNRYPSLLIPSTTWWQSGRVVPRNSQVLPTPSSSQKVPVSPAALSLLPPFVPALHAPPSLDGSVSSDQVSNLSTPITPEGEIISEHQWHDEQLKARVDPNVGRGVDESNDDMAADVDIAIETREDDWDPLLMGFPQIPVHVEANPAEAIPIRLDTRSPVSQTQSEDGLLLPADALATLQQIPVDGSPEPWSGSSDESHEMWQLPHLDGGHGGSEANDPASALSGHSFTNLSIPSPAHFFSSLGPKARHTWSLPNPNNPPSSATAEQFYNCPWNRSDEKIAQHVLEYPEPSPADNQLTAVLPQQSSTGPQTNEVPERQQSDIRYEYDESYEEALRKQAAENLDRTSFWISAQESYLAALSGTSPEITHKPVSTSSDPPQASQNESPLEPRSKRAVRFVEDATPRTDSPHSIPATKDPIYWSGFQSILRQSRRLDVFLHSNTRFDTVQSVRLGLPDKHIDSLMGKFELVQPERPPYKGPFSQAPRNSVATETLAQRALFAKIEKEQMVLAQLQQSMWAIDALRYLNGGSLLSSPASKRLSTATHASGSPTRPGKRRARVLDLGGQATCGWAWHLAHDYPNIKIYTVVTKQSAVNHNIRGPSNYRQISVPCLWKLPFHDNQFDVISARSLHALLKAEHPVGENMDEVDLCLQECYRCLKPGGYIEFFLVDAEIAQPGPYGSAASVEFASNLRTRGYDPTPTKKFLARLRRSHFMSIKRAWVFLPMGTEPVRSQPPQETPEPTATLSPVHNYKAIGGPVGTTTDVASMAGLLGGWVWEQWLLNLQLEMGREREKLLAGVGSVFDEGRKNGSGWTCLCGWAMKPETSRRQ